MMWTGTAASWVDLHPSAILGVSSARYSVALAANATQQVGYGRSASATASLDRAFVWSGTAASVVNLHSYLPGGYVESWAYGIDASGNVVGRARDGAGDHAVMWKVLVPEPGTCAALAAGLLAIRRRKRARSYA
jgi:hypothetical protein